MCGLFGEIGRNSLTDRTAIARIGQSLRHRGPDAKGQETGAGWMLGFRRLAILDLSSDGNQPMRSQDGQHILVFNGEIYNYLELRRGLEAAGERFRTGTDTEVLLRLLMRDGVEALGRLNGMFALAYLDLRRRRFLLARDRLGVKPLYYRLGGGTLRFGSELRALRAWPGAESALSPEAVFEYLALGYVPGDRCIFKGYAKLPPGHVIAGDIDRPAAAPRRWWRLDIRPDPGDPGDPGGEEARLEELDALLTDAVRIRMRSDVPLALLLSGGLDSGLVGAYMAQAGTAPKALVAGFDHPDYDESGLARETADHVGMPVEILLMRDSNLSDVDLVARAFDEPFGDPSALPMLHICKAARAHATVLLTGDGGDEAFAGYRRYLELRKYRGIMALPDRLLLAIWALGRGRLAPRHTFRLAKATLPSGLLGAVFDGLGLGRDPALGLILPAQSTPLPDVVGSVRRQWQATAGRDLLSRQRAFDYAHYLPDDVLVKVDRSSMAVSTEARSPFLDYRIVEFAARLPTGALVHQGMGKTLLRRLGQRRLPQRVSGGGKRGFGVPVGDWTRRPEGAAFVRARLTDPGTQSHGLWHEAGVAEVLQAHLDRKRDHGEHLWRLLILESWLRQNAPGATA